MIDDYCASSARAVKEPLYGTTSHKTVWFLLEYPGAWGAKAVPESPIPQAVQDKLFADDLWNVLLIKQERRADDHAPAFYIAVVEEQNPALYRFDLQDYSDILKRDLRAIIAGNAAAPVDEKLFLVCTNGKRDRCCAQFGMAMYRALSALSDETVWQCSHVGGHRFAANVLCMPHGIGYGFLVPDDAEAVIHRYHDQRLLLNRYRGRACYSKPVQAAHHFALEALQSDAIDALTLVDTVQADSIWTVTFAALNGQTATVRLAVEDSPFTVLASCGDETAKSVPYYRLLTAETVSSDDRVI